MSYCDSAGRCDIMSGVKDEKKIPEGYELKNDMFGEPYLQRKPTPRQRRLAELIFVPALILIVLLICWIVFC